MVKTKFPVRVLAVSVLFGICAYVSPDGWRALVIVLWAVTVGLFLGAHRRSNGRNLIAMAALSSLELKAVLQVSMDSSIRAAVGRLSESETHYLMRIGGRSGRVRCMVFAQLSNGDLGYFKMNISEFSFGQFSRIDNQSTCREIVKKYSKAAPIVG